MLASQSEPRRGLVHKDFTNELDNPKYSELKSFIKSIECLLGKIEDWIDYDKRLMRYETAKFNENGQCECKTCNILESFDFYNIRDN